MTTMRSSVRTDPRKVIGWVTVLVGLALGLFVSLGFAETWQERGIADFLRIGLGFFIILSAVIATRNFRIAAYIALLLALAVAAFMVLHVYSVFPTWELMAPSLLVMGVFTLPGFFWLLMSVARWPAPIQSALLSNRPTLAAVLGGVLSFIFLAAAVMAHPFLPDDWMTPISADCSPISLLNEWGQPRGIDFTARIVFVGPRTYHGYSLWAIARTERRFSKPTQEPPDLIVLRGYFHSDDQYQTYFVEGVRQHALFSRFFPTIAPFGCGHTDRVQDAGVALRILQDVPPASGGRIIGAIYDDYRATRRPVTGITITATGPSGNAVSVTDAHGIFDFPQLPPGHYVLQRSDIGNSAWEEADLQNGTVIDFRVP